MKLVYLRDEETHATALLRYYIPADYLMRHGHEVIMKSSFSHDQTGLNDPHLREADLLISGQFVFAEDLPYFQMFKKAGKKIILDADDWYLESHMKRVQRDLDGYVQIARLADGITVASKYLGELYHRKLKIPKEKIYYLPNACLVDVWQSALQKNHSRITKNKARGLCIGLMGASNHLPDWGDIALPVLREIRKRYPKVRFEVLGLPMSFSAFYLKNKDIMDKSFLDKCADTYVELQELKVKPIKTVMKYEEFVPTITSLGWDIGLATLANTRTDKSKSFLKYLDFTMAGVVGVYRGISPFTEVIRDGENGLMANKFEEWVEKITYLLENPDQRSEILKKATEDVAVNHNFKYEWSKWSDVYQKIISGASGG